MRKAEIIPIEPDTVSTGAGKCVPLFFVVVFFKACFEIILRIFSTPHLHANGVFFVCLFLKMILRKDEVFTSKKLCITILIKNQLLMDLSYGLA